jgi:outer membrane protein assembly factor BamB
MKLAFLGRISSRMLALLLLAAASQPLPQASAEDGQYWYHWRGVNSQGVAPAGRYPVRWTIQDNVDWRVEIEGRGGSTPIVAGNLALVTLGLEGKNRLSAFDLATGTVTWTTPLGSDTGGKHKKGSGSNPSPTTDGQHVYAYFRSGDLGCVTMQGDVVWQENLQAEFGEDTLWWDLGSSPLLTDRAIVVAVMQSQPSPSYVAAFNKLTGELMWKVERELKAPEEAAQSYTSPLLATLDGKQVIVLLGADHLTIQSAEDGRELGRLGGFNPNAERYYRSIASPVVDGNIVVCPYSRGSTLTAVDMQKLVAGEGQASILWHHEGQGTDVPTPAVQNGRLYLCSDRGQVQALDIKSGETIWELALPKNRLAYSSSPLVTETHLYLTREDGTVFVVALPEKGGKASLVAENSLGDDTQFTVASPVPMDQAILFRTAGTLIKIGL